MEMERRAPKRMIKIDWLELMGTWTIFGFYSAILVEADGKVVGRALRWSWHDWNKSTPNIFRVYDRACHTRNYASPKEINK